MCGIVGIEFSKLANAKKIKYWIKKTLTISSRRGKDSSGISFLVKEKETFSLVTFRSENSIEITLKNIKINKFIDDVYKKNSRIIFIIGHTRLATNGATINYNNQPLVYNKNTQSLVFNGILCNSEKIIKLSKLKKNSLNDGVALWSLDKSINYLKKIKGAFSYIKINCQRRISIDFITNNGSLYSSMQPNQIINKIFLSEESFFKKMNINNYKQIKINKMFSVDISNNNYAINLNKNKLINIKSENLKKIKIFTIKKNIVPKNLKYKIDKRIDYIFNKITRCKKCILPNTHPFIYFNQDGICNFCVNYKKDQLKPKKEFKNILRYTQKKYGNKSILCPLSGGRDSSFALHILVNELKIKPITYTYDWGFNTDLARRNVSIMTGELNIENIIIAADIRHKRENVKKNVIAWLKRPHLGLVPLFMAGDKQFISNASLLKKELNMKLEIFAINKYEVTQYKEEFSGIKLWDENLNNKHTNMKILSQLKMLFFYGKQFLLNPYYLNTSIPDSFRGFLNFYHSGSDEMSIYDYYDWNENVINKTLINKYGGETANDTSSTWRIGDGTQPFYNFIYFMFAGFTENDVLRSFLIRDNKISREEALCLVTNENQPRYPTLEGYFKLLDLNYIKILSTIIDHAWTYKLNYQNI